MSIRAFIRYFAATWLCLMAWALACHCLLIEPKQRTETHG